MEEAIFTNGHRCLFRPRTFFQSGQATLPSIYQKWTPSSFTEGMRGQRFFHQVYALLKKMLFFFRYDLNSALNSTISHHLGRRSWSLLDPRDRRPPALYGHAASALPGGRALVLFGGSDGAHRARDELWRLDAESSESGSWGQVKAGGDKPAGVSMHTLTLAPDGFLYLFGGGFENGSFSSDLHRIDAGELETWQRVEYSGVKSADLRLAGHTVVADAERGALLLFGGIAADVPRFSRLSGDLLHFDLATKIWTRIEGRGTEGIPSPRFACSFPNSNLI